ncbi:DUF2934 domain-containing protein [Pseudomonas sp. HR1]|jgi:hypothetical protein|uniref:DUF2934 domain-containing protein n=1 Tax=Pseudomonas TaxID=286 RepID=UPI0011A0D0B1|nr:MULTISPECIES: DUF2934 domain-containing protein [Pseudomonas]MDK4198797.1 DUF2934 domain-containing protein [Pseudomonas sp. HR1]
MTLEERIRQRAYEIWEREGRPHGQDFEHWFQANRELEDQPDDNLTQVGGIQSSVAPPAPKPRSRSRKKNPEDSTKA